MELLTRPISTALVRRAESRMATKDAPGPSEQKAVIIDPRFFWGPGFAFSSSGLVIDPDRAEVNQQIAYGIASLAYICMEYRAKKFSEPTLMIVDASGDEDETLEDHELAGLLARPAPDTTMREMLRLTSLLRDSTGACLWYKVRGRGVGADAQQLRPFGKDEVTVEPLGDRWRGRFRITGVRGPEIDATWQDVIYFLNPDPRSGLRVNGAVAPLDAALNLINLDETVRVQARNLIRKAVRPTGAFMTDQNLSDDQYERAREQINQRVQGPQNAGDWLLLEGGAKWQQIQQTLSETFPEPLMTWIESRVCAAFGLHPSVLGLKSGIENSPWSNLETATENIYEETILPRLAEDAETLTDQLLREFDGDRDH
ncbi:MAG: phage portal protein, partial [Acidimicrobiia bacterium]